MGSIIEPGHLKSVAEVEQFLRGGRFRYALEPIRCTDADGGPTWMNWLTLPALGQALERRVFLEAVESLGLSALLEQRSSRDAVRWLSSRDDDRRIGLTISGQSLIHPDLASRLLGLFTESGIDPARICFNLAVDAALADLGGATRFVKAARSAGSLITLCNGIPGNPVLGLYGPLGYVNHLRVDRRWIQAAPTSISHRHTLESIVDYAKRLKLEVIADGVERRDQLELVSGLGIDYYAGPLDGAPELVAESSGSGAPLRRFAAG